MLQLVDSPASDQASQSRRHADSVSIPRSRTASVRIWGLLNSVTARAEPQLSSTRQLDLHCRSSQHRAEGLKNGSRSSTTAVNQRRYEGPATTTTHLSINVCCSRIEE